MNDDETAGRRRHYGQFYGIEPLPGDNAGRTGRIGGGARPLVVLWGNCQAEALRQLLQGSPSGAIRSVRLPPVHELTADDLPHVARVLATADVLLAQPVADDYRGLPLGTRQVGALLPDGGRVVRWPVLFDAALYPFQVLVRHESAGDPPVVPYHDLRTLIEAATGRRPRSGDAAAASRRYVELAERSRAALAARERRHATVVVSDQLAKRSDRTALDFHTINHPGNRMLLAAAHAAQLALRLEPDAVDPRRVLLNAVLTPQQPDVLEALGLTPAPGRDAWLLAGERVEDEVVRSAHLAFYREHPGFIEAGLHRHADTIKALGL